MQLLTFVQHMPSYVIMSFILILYGLQSTMFVIAHIFQWLNLLVTFYLVDNVAQFESMHSYDVADMFKQYLRELPECLVTHKLSDTFLAIYQHVPQELRLEALQACALLLPGKRFGPFPVLSSICSVVFSEITVCEW